MVMDYLCQRLHVIQSLKQPIHLHVGMEKLPHLVDFFFHPSDLLSGYFHPRSLIHSRYEGGLNNLPQNPAPLDFWVQ